MKISSENRKKILILVIYLSINVLSIRVQFLPGMVTFFLWVVIAPLCAITIAWVNMKKNPKNTSSEFKIFGVTSLFFIGSGVASFLFISTLWASV
jgi:hypothetical protein